MKNENEISVRRLASVFDEPVSTVGRWTLQKPKKKTRKRIRPTADRPEIRTAVREEAFRYRQHHFGYRMITAMLRRRDFTINRKTVYTIMREENLLQKKLRYKPSRPKRVRKMRPERPNQAWQIDMTSFQLSDLTPMFLVTIIDCCTRQIVGWSLDRRCRAVEWTTAVRDALEKLGLQDKQAVKELQLVLRSDNGCQPCSKKFVEYLSKSGVKGEYTGYNAPDDNAYVERVIRTIKEEAIYASDWDFSSEAHRDLEDYINYYNAERIHSSLNYQTPNEYAATYLTQVAA